MALFVFPDVPHPRPPGSSPATPSLTQFQSELQLPFALGRPIPQTGLPWGALKKATGYTGKHETLKARCKKNTDLLDPLKAMKEKHETSTEGTLESLVLEMSNHLKKLDILGDTKETGSTKKRRRK